MAELYFELKRKLEELGYTNTLTQDAVPLVECILADLLQTTKSLQHYMDMSKTALKQRDAVLLEIEPYKCDNTKLIQENILLHKQFMSLKEEHQKVLRETKRKIRHLTDEVANKDSLIAKLNLELRDIGLRGICANTYSSRSKIRKKVGDNADKPIKSLCSCSPYDTDAENEIKTMKVTIQNLQEKNEILSDEVELLKDKIENRNEELIRLTMLLEGGRPVTALFKDCCDKNTNTSDQELLDQITELETENKQLKNQLNQCLEKQHEAMVRALQLSEDNKKLENELNQVDALALKVEAECNEKIAIMAHDIDHLQQSLYISEKKYKELEQKCHQKQNLEKTMSQKYSFTDQSQNTVSKSSTDLRSALDSIVAEMQQVQHSLQIALKEKDTFCKEFKNMLFKNLQDTKQYEEVTSMHALCATKNDLKEFLDKDKNVYENHIKNIQKNLNDIVDLFYKQNTKPKLDRENLQPVKNGFITELNNKICEGEQKLLQLKLENDELKQELLRKKCNKYENYEDVIENLNEENSELTRENIELSKLLSEQKQKTASITQKPTELETTKIDLRKEWREIEKLKNENEILQKDKQEYIQRYKEAVKTIEILKRDLAMKHEQFEQLDEENRFYKINSRSGRASADHLKEECQFLREQIKKMQSDVIKEKTLASQIKNIQIETERSSNDLQNELLFVQKQLSLSKDNITALEKKNKDLQSEIIVLKSDKANLADNIKSVDRERDKLIIELDNKTETLCVAEQKFKSQSYEIERLEKEIADLKRKISMNKVAEHKLSDYETQLHFLNSEIQRISQQFENALMENKELQNSLANVNGTLKVTRIEYEKSRKEADGLREQLQHYVAEVRRIEDLMTQKEAERTDMLEHFASLSVEANLLENNNQSLENESASKSIQLQSSINKIQEMENKVIEKDNLIDSQSAQIASMHCKITSLENEVQLLREEKLIQEKNIAYLKQLFRNYEFERKHLTEGKSDADSELKMYEKKIKNLCETKSRLEMENEDIKRAVKSTETLLSQARNEVVQLKLALQDATSETKILKDRVNRMKGERGDSMMGFDKDNTSTSTRHLEVTDLCDPIVLEETIHEIIHEDDEVDEMVHYRDMVERRFSRFSHGGTI